MRGLIALVLLAASGWSGYWWIGSTAQEKAFETWFATQRAAGWIAEHDELRVIGFPNRFDTHITNLHLADPGRSWSWTAQRFQILSLSYKPNHVIAAWPGRQEIGFDGNRYSIKGDRIRASVILVPDTGLALDRLTLELIGTTVRDQNGASAKIEKGVVAARRSEQPDAPDYSYDFSVDLNSVGFPDTVLSDSGLTGVLPANLELFTATGLLRFDKYWDRTTIGDQPALLGVDIGSLEVKWGEIQLNATGKLDVAADGFAEGNLSLDVRNWQKLVLAAKSAGKIDANTAQSLDAGLRLLAGLGGAPDRIKLPLTFRAGRTYVGPIDVGEAPRLAYRQ